VPDIFKYYVAYKAIAVQEDERRKSKESLFAKATVKLFLPGTHRSPVGQDLDVVLLYLGKVQLGRYSRPPAQFPNR
jgi:hypothetical protein